MSSFQKICCKNHGAFEMEFSVELGGSGQTPSTGAYFFGSKTIDLADPDLPPVTPGTWVWPLVVVVGGTGVEGDTVQYEPNGLTAVYDVTGISVDPHIKLENPDGAGDSAGDGEGDAAGRPVSAPGEPAM